MKHKNRKLSKLRSLFNYEFYSVTVFNQRIHVVQIIGLLFIFLVWEFLPRIAPVSQGLMPSLATVFTESFENFSVFYNGDSIQDPMYQALFVIAENTKQTVRRYIISVGGGLFCGLILGLAISWNERIRSTFEPLMTGIRIAPQFALIPLFILWFGRSEVGKLIFAGYAVAVYFAVNVLTAHDNLPEYYREFGSTLGASKLKQYQTIVLPGIVPELVGGMRMILGFGWAIVLGAEFVAPTSGLGWLLIRSQNLFQPGQIFIIVITFLILTTVVNGLFLLISRRMTKWA